MVYVCCLLLTLLLLISGTSSAETVVNCPFANSDCTCWENEEQLLRIRCNSVSLGTMKSDIAGSNSLGSVWKLQLYFIEETSLPKDYVKDFTALTELEIRFSDTFSLIEPGAFNGASNLEVIYFSSNGFKWLSGDMFEGVTESLTDLLLSSNDIVYLYSDLEDIFLKTSSEISLLGNPLKCTCQLKWLADLLNSDKTLPDISGAACRDSDDVLYSLTESNVPFTDCPDVCSEGFHNCNENEICAVNSTSQSFYCHVMSNEPVTSSALVMDDAVSSSQTVFLSSSNIAISPTSIQQFSDILTSSDYSISSVLTMTSQFTYPSIDVMQSLINPSPSLLHTNTDTSDNTYTLPSLYSSAITDTSDNVYTFPASSPTISPSPSPIITLPGECGNEICLVTQFCSMACDCPYCACGEGLSWSGNVNVGSCVVPGLGQAVCSDDGFIGLTWPTVTAGSVIAIPCCSSGNQCGSMANRGCTLSGEWTDFSGSDCISTSVYSLQSLYDSAKEGDKDALNNLGATILEESNNQMLLPEDLLFLSEQIIQIIDLVEDISDPQIISDIVNSVSNLLNDNLVDVWQEQEMPSSVIAQLFNAIEILGTNHPINNGTVTIITKNLALQVIIPKGDELGWNISSALLNGTALEGQSSIFLPGSLLMDALGGQDFGNCSVRVIASLWDVDLSLLQVNNSASSGNQNVEPLVHGVCDWSDGTEPPSSDALSVNSIIISASLYSPNCTLNTSQLSKPVQITLHHINQSLDDPTCSFLDPQGESGNEWVGGGCRVQDAGSSDDQTVCECFHLTSFALLMSPTGSVSISKSLNIATKVGLSVSILALIVTCILLFSLKLESELNIVHRQLALALCLSQILFLVGVDRVSIPYPDAACTVIAALLHYLLLCTFAWTLIEGIHLYLFIVKVFYNKKIIWSYFPLAWGVPVIIVGITLGPSFCAYGSKNFCWITTGQGANWAFHGPVLLVVAVNIVVLIIITGVVIRSARRKDPDSCGFCKLLQASFVLVPTLGLTWILGFFVVSDGVYATVVEWIFFVCTTLQGIFIFTIHCVLNTEVRASFLKSLGFRQAARKQKSVFSLKPNLPTFNSIAASGFRRLSLGGGSRRGSLEPLASDQSNGLPNPQDLKDIQKRFGLPLATVNEEDTDHQSSEELETHMSNGLTQENGKTLSNDLIPLEDDDQGTDSTINLLERDAEIRRSSTFGLLEEEKQGIYKVETWPDESASDSTGDNSRTDLLKQTNDIIPETVDKEERIELTGFSLGVTLDTVPSAVSVLKPTDCNEPLKSKSMSHIEENRCLNGNGELVRWCSDSKAGSQVLNSFEGALNPKLTEIDNHSSQQTLSDYDYFNISSPHGDEDAIRKSMEDLLNQQSNNSSHTLDNELQSSKSQENMFY